MKLNEFKKAQLEADLKTAQMDITPEKFKANAIVKAMLIGVFAIPMAFILPLLSPVVLFLAAFLYRKEMKAVFYPIMSVGAVCLSFLKKTIPIMKN